MNLVAEPVKTAKGTQGFSAEERENLILKHLPQVRMVARKIHARVPDSVSLDDLISTGTMGLISAIDHFDWSRNIQLKTYAEHKIRGAILDGLRRLDWVPREQRKHAKQIQAAIGAVEQRVHRAPTEEEIAAELNLTVDSYHKWHMSLHGLTLASLDSVTSEDSESRDLLHFISGDPSESPGAQLERSELQRALAGAISHIPAVEKTILSLYYSEELSLREISKIVGLHESRISQLKQQAILRLRVSMSKLWPATGQHPSLTRPKPCPETRPAFTQSQAA